MRFVCALLVIGIHVYPFGNNGDPLLTELNFLTQVWLGRICVPFFLVCTGFFLFRQGDAMAFPGEKVRNCVKKLLRLYLLWTLLYFPLILREIILLPGQPLGVGLLKFFRNFFFAGSYYHLWYLHAGLVAVGLVGLLLSRGIRLKRILPVAAVLFLAGLLPQTYFGILMRLRERLPLVWKVWEVYEVLFVTTRNGLFEGFLYVALGAWFAGNHSRPSVKGAAIGFVVSMALALAELLTVRRLRWLNECDLFLFQVPSTCFLFCMACRIRGNDSPLWPHLRHLANISYFLHVWVMKLLAAVFPVLGVDVTIPGVHFLSTAAVTLLLAEGLLRLQKKPRFAFLGRIYG